MDWRMVLRRCPARSMTFVGDLAQTSTPGGADSWAQVLDPAANAHRHRAALPPSRGRRYRLARGAEGWLAARSANHRGGRAGKVDRARPAG